MKRIVAAFDFDGTLTTKDTLLEFIKFSCGKKAFCIGFLLHSPLLVLMLLHLYPNWKAKQLIFSYFFKDWDYESFRTQGEGFVKLVECCKRNTMVNTLEKHVRHGDSVYVISASIEEWVRPWAEKHGVTGVMGTQIEVGADGKLTGRFKSKNCYGKEKVKRLLQVEPDRNSYYLYAYGDSRGDKCLIDFSDEGRYVK